MCKKTKTLTNYVAQIKQDVARRVKENQGNETLQMVARLAELHATTAEIAEISTRRLLVLTWVLSALTAVLVIFTVILAKDTRTLVESESLQKPTHREQS